MMAADVLSLLCTGSSRTGTRLNVPASNRRIDASQGTGHRIPRLKNSPSRAAQPELHLVVLGSPLGGLLDEPGQSLCNQAWAGGPRRDSTLDGSAVPVMRSTNVGTGKAPRNDSRGLAKKCTVALSESSGGRI
jgi:hypothetical protein